MGSASASVSAAAGVSSRKIWRVPVAIVARSPSRSRRAAKRLSVGNSTVATATENIPWGSM
jgi:hypothetical protein